MAMIHKISWTDKGKNGSNTKSYPWQSLIQCMNRKGKMAMIQNPIPDHNVKKVGKNGIDTKPMIKALEKKGKKKKE